MADNPTSHGPRVLLTAAAAFIAVFAIAVFAVMRIADQSGFAERISQAPLTAEERLADAIESPTLAVVPLYTDPESDVSTELVQLINSGLVDALSGGGLRLPGQVQMEPFRGKEVTPAEVGEAVGVRYVLIAAVGGVDSEVRVDAVLHDVMLGNSIFRGSFYGDRASAVSVREEVVTALLETLDKIRG